MSPTLIGQEIQLVELIPWEVCDKVAANVMKLKALAEGAQLATKKLWGRAN